MSEGKATKKEYDAFCEDCGWESKAANALANAATHSRRYGHLVIVGVASSVVYDNRELGRRPGGES